MEISLPAASAQGHLRPLNLLRDLTPIADLIELCFADTMDRDGRTFLEQMRRNARDTAFLRWAPAVIDSISLPLSGFVWEDQGKIIGNVSLIPYRSQGRRITLIANVATHPEHRRAGIARQLTLAALNRIRERGAEAWLQVRHDNLGALRLYQSLGFQERARRTSWILPAQAAFSTQPLPEGLHFASRSGAAWEMQRTWLEAAYPEALNWFNLRPGVSVFGASMWNGLYRLAADINLMQWTVYEHNQLRGVLSAQETFGSRIPLWLALSPQASPQVVAALLQQARLSLGRGVALRLEYPSGPADEGLQAAGLEASRTLLWMQAV